MKKNCYYPSTFPKDKEKLLITLLVELNKKPIDNRKKLENEIRSFLKKKKITDYFPSFWHLYFVYQRHFKNKRIEKELINLLKVVKIRSLSGIVPLSVFTHPKNSCPYHCLYCPTAEGAPKSYFPDEAAVLRASRHHYLPFNQTLDRLIQFYLSGHPIDKIDLIIQGGTFSFYDRKYRQWFVKRVFDCCNSDVEELIIKGDTMMKNSRSLDQSKKINERAKSRIVGITIETRPDFINEDEIRFLRHLGVTRVELGVQHPDDKIYQKILRGHTVKDVIKATQLLKDAGFKITYHLMPGLPGSNFKKDIQMLKTIFQNNAFKPDAIKFYPTQVVKNSQLADWYKKDQYQPINEQYLYQLTKEFKKKIVPPWVRINRLVRDLTINDLVYENFPSNFRQIIEKRLKEEKVFCPCIRCREIRNNKIFGQVKIDIIQYQANGGQEFFIEAVDEKYQLLGFLRLRLPSFIFTKEKFFISSLEGSAIIRELHIYGQATPLSEKGDVQHQGLGKKLIKKAEEITNQFGLKKLAVIAAVGVRDYYRQLGFDDDNSPFEYLIKIF